jgi:hyaluronan synthase
MLRQAGLLFDSSGERSACEAAADPGGGRLRRGVELSVGASRLRVLPVLLAVAIAACAVAYKVWSIDLLFGDPVFAAYAVVVGAYFFSRLALSVVYRPTVDRAVEPTVAVVIPAFNEEEAIERSVDAILAADYPRGKLEVVIVNDGSTDATGAVLDRITVTREGVGVVHFGRNRGKRAAMAAGIRATSAEIVVFVDSDSVLAPDALRWIVQDFAAPDVGAVAGHADVLNPREAWLTRVQAVWYLVSFRVYKAAESVFGAVTCCSGCFSAYRRAAITDHLAGWEGQTFLGRPATVGDDRALTNLVLRDWKTRYQARAHSATLVPSELRKFLIQQARWKRSWTRESVRLGAYVWRKHPLAAAPTYASIALPLLAPWVLARAVVCAPLTYLAGIAVIALLYGLYYACWRGLRDTVWPFGVLFVALYLGFLVWQTYYSIITVRHTKWGTRPANPLLAAEAPA